jgi:hypothetical protein
VGVIRRVIKGSAGREDPVEEAAGRLSIDCLKTGSLKNQDVMAFVTLYMPMSLAGADFASAYDLSPGNRFINSLPEKDA